MNAYDLIAFEEEVAASFERKEILGPIHLCSPSQAEKLIEIFKEIRSTDWVLSTWRSHWHALLHGVPREKVMNQILAGKSMALHFPEHRFMTSAIMGGMLPIACGLAAAGEKAWCFIGDMCARTGTFHDTWAYSLDSDLRINIIVEDNGLSVNTPTDEVWGHRNGFVVPAPLLHRYTYKRTTNHSGTDRYVAF